MLSDILVIFILTISGKPDLYSTQVFAPTSEIDCAGDGVSIRCLELEHVDPDTQPKEDGA